MPYKILTVLWLGLWLSACGMAETFQEMAEQQEKVAEQLKERHGWEAQIGWNVHNGVLAQVTLSVSASQVREETVADLEAAITEIVLENFESKPQAIVIQIVGGQ